MKRVLTMVLVCVATGCATQQQFATRKEIEALKAQQDASDKALWQVAQYTAGMNDLLIRMIDKDMTAKAAYADRQAQAQKAADESKAQGK